MPLAGPAPAAPASLPLLPPLALLVPALGVAGAAALANCAVITALLRRSRNGLSCLLIQLAIADFMLLATTAGPELWSYNVGSWSFGLPGCVAYQGIDIFTSTASLYIIVTIALHSLATINVEERVAMKRNRRSQYDDDQEIRSSRHSLVANSDSSTPPRSMNVDYRLLDTRVRVPVMLPSVFAWVLAASLSVPEFALSTTVNRDGAISCTLIDTNHRVNMHSLLVAFNFLLPVCILLVTSVVAIAKLSQVGASNELNTECVPALKLSLWLTFSFCALCGPRAVFFAYRVFYSLSGEPDGTRAAEAPSGIFSLAFSMAYLLATLVRPFLYVSLLPGLRQYFTFRARHVDENQI